MESNPHILKSYFQGNALSHPQTSELLNDQVQQALEENRRNIAFYRANPEEIGVPESASFPEKQILMPTQTTRPPPDLMQLKMEELAGKMPSQEEPKSSQFISPQTLKIRDQQLQFLLSTSGKLLEKSGEQKINNEVLLQQSKLLLDQEQFYRKTGQKQHLTQAEKEQTKKSMPANSDSSEDDQREEDSYMSDSSSSYEEIPQKHKKQKTQKQRHNQLPKSELLDDPAPKKSNLLQQRQVPATNNFNMLQTPIYPSPPQMPLLANSYVSDIREPQVQGLIYDLASPYQQQKQESLVTNTAIGFTRNLTWCPFCFSYVGSAMIANHSSYCSSIQRSDLQNLRPSVEISHLNDKLQNLMTLICQRNSPELSELIQTINNVLSKRQGSDQSVNLMEVHSQLKQLADQCAENPRLIQLAEVLDRMGDIILRQLNLLQNTQTLNAVPEILLPKQDQSIDLQKLLEDSMMSGNNKSHQSLNFDSNELPLSKDNSYVQQKSSDRSRNEKSRRIFSQRS